MSGAVRVTPGGAIAMLERNPRSAEVLDVTPVTRTVVWLYDVEGWSHEEIARAFERTVSFSKSQLARGHARLRNDLAAPLPAQLGVPLGSELDGH